MACSALRWRTAHSTFSIGRPARRQATKPPATSAAPLRSVAFDRTAVLAEVDRALALGLEEVTRQRDGHRAGRSAVSAALEFRPGRALLLHKVLTLCTEQKQWKKAVEVIDKLVALETDPARRAKYRYAEGAICQRSSSCCMARPTLEIDHIVSERADAHPGTGAKDRLENAPHAMVCRGAMGCGHRGVELVGADRELVAAHVHGHGCRGSQTLELGDLLALAEAGRSLPRPRPRRRARLTKRWLGQRTASSSA